jgi:hypothetical protein
MRQRRTPQASALRSGATGGKISTKQSRGSTMTREHILPPEGEGRPDADAFGRALGPGIGLNLLVGDIEAAARFQARVLGAVVDYWDRDFAILRAQGAVWMLHSDRSYRDHPLSGVATAAEGRGAGAELRLYGRDPDVAGRRRSGRIRRQAARGARGLYPRPGGLLLGADDSESGSESGRLTLL